MPAVDLVIRGQRVAFPEAIADSPESARSVARSRSFQLAPASIHISNGTITVVADYDDVPAGCPIDDAGANSVIIPGLVDTHVHVNEPGRTDWEGFATATRAAAAGGVTTLVDMPLNCLPVTTTRAAFHAKVESARAQSHVDVGFWGGVV